MRAPRPEVSHESHESTQHEHEEDDPGLFCVIFVSCCVSCFSCSSESSLQQIVRGGIRIDLARGDAVDDRAELAGAEYLPLEMIHEPLRHQLAQTVLAA